ncbi:MAG: intradiol ring-cleavage dioxygenase [Bacteroidia bacterium]|nr:intradiol ring-cleavage dioxygenase [Bacteroidia bacterium]NND52300.1 intradiol ring-cleavage dioxygenase [Flavobacteriaceae bacterium]
MKVVHLLLCLLMLVWSCGESQNNRNATAVVGGPCEGCEAVFEYGQKNLSYSDTIVGFGSLKDPIHISGTVFERDGKTKAKNIIIYVYHTDDKGIYPTNTNSKGWERRHGYLRTWLKTDDNGRYSFYSSRPASYPNSTIPQHIHFTIKEPNKNEYYIDDIYFEDDPHLTDRIRLRKNPRGGSGVIQLQSAGKLKVATRDIILGLNIPNYPN